MLYRKEVLQAGGIVRQTESTKTPTMHHRPIENNYAKRLVQCVLSRVEGYRMYGRGLLLQKLSVFDNLGCADRQRCFERLNRVFLRWARAYAVRKLFVKKVIDKGGEIGNAHMKW